VLGPEYLEDQLQGGPTHQARTFERETTLAHNFESSGNPHPDPHVVEPQPVVSQRALTPSELLRRKSEHLAAIRTLADQFGAKIVDVSENSVIVEMSGKTTRVNAFLSLVKPFGILESARTGRLPNIRMYSPGMLNVCLIGTMAMPRTPISTSPEDTEPIVETSGPVDPSLLPPG
jgi:acetolactate synthase-1/3 small subunit